MLLQRKVYAITTNITNIIINRNNINKELWHKKINLCMIGNISSFCPWVNSLKNVDHSEENLAFCKPMRRVKSADCLHQLWIIFDGQNVHRQHLFSLGAGHLHSTALSTTFLFNDQYLTDICHLYFYVT